ncbi:MAG: hypothetical protein ACF8AM_04720, partial [Rhodopirellula sp. JB055]|uniref:hypothetical protein n=1 Tax=Rhodopirellula sp. JB055 TaxID=3342846 RepID=UPI00370C54E7
REEGSGDDILTPNKEIRTRDEEGTKRDKSAAAHTKHNHQRATNAGHRKLTGEPTPPLVWPTYRSGKKAQQTT